MATETRVDSGNVVTYTITDAQGSTVTVTVTQTAVTGFGVTFASSGGLGSDGLAMLQPLLNALTIGVLPMSPTQSF
jgi:transcriptional regulator of nitric oxide reductase